MENLEKSSKGKKIMHGKSWLSPHEVAELLGVNRRTVTNHIKKGKIKADKDESGYYVIEKKDFFIAFPHLLQQQIEADAHGTTGKNSAKIEVRILEEKINYLMQIIKEKEEKADILREQLHNSSQKEFKMLDAINSNARLLEFKETSARITEKQQETKWKWLFKKR